MRLIVVAGFLGSGKTTVLLEIARHLVAAGRKVAVIENEIGEVGIDGRYVAEQGLVVKELFGGCICCTLAIGIVDALKTIARTYDPDYVLLEPSGIARPGDVIATVDQYASDIDDVAVVTLIDVERFDVFLEVLGPMLEGQVARANVIAQQGGYSLAGAGRAHLERGAHTCPGGPGRRRVGARPRKPRFGRKGGAVMGHEDEGDGFAAGKSLAGGHGHDHVKDGGPQPTVYALQTAGRRAGISARLRRRSGRHPRSGFADVRS